MTASGESARRPAVKICGVTRPEDARAAVTLGARLIGLNFYPRSPRFLTVERALEVRRAIGDDALVVGVFVNPEPAELESLDRRLGLDLIQFQGDEDARTTDPFSDRAIRTLRAPARPAAGELERLAAPYSGYWALLFDTPKERLDSPDQYGGSGHPWGYRAIASLVAGASVRVLAAGGIGPDNVRELLVQLPGLWGVDLCSSVETAPGIKDTARMVELFQEIDAAGTRIV